MMFDFVVMPAGAIGAASAPPIVDMKIAAAAKTANAVFMRCLLESPLAANVRSKCYGSKTVSRSIDRQERPAVGAAGALANKIAGVGADNAASLRSVVVQAVVETPCAVGTAIVQASAVVPHRL
jgi:hypothetical protein